MDVPPMRLDLEIEEDMAEEIGRVLGYDKVINKIPKINFIPKVNETYAKIILFQLRCLPLCTTMLPRPSSAISSGLILKLANCIVWYLAK